MGLVLVLLQKIRGDFMPNYEEMYLIMMRATEKAMKDLIEAQKKCEELYIKAKNPPPPVILSILPPQK